MSKTKSHNTSTRSSQQIIQATFRVSPRILDHLGLSAYNSIAKSLAELCVNAFDADATKVWVDLPLRRRSVPIVVQDNGRGMSQDDVLNEFLLVGYDKRRHGQRTSQDRLLIGQKGIGKFAGLGVASVMEVTSWRDGIELTFKIERERFYNHRDLVEHPLEITQTRATRPGNGTIVRLSRLNRDVTFPTDKFLRLYLFSVLPQVPNFEIFVNDENCSAIDIPGQTESFVRAIADLGEVNGFYTLADRRQKTPGLAVKVRGRMVREPSLFGVDVRRHGFFIADRLIGEINAEFLDPELRPKNLPDLINTSRNGFLEDAPIVQKFEHWTTRFLEEVIDGFEQRESDKRVTAVLDDLGVKGGIKRLPADVRGRVESTIIAIVRKLRHNTEEELVPLMIWIIRYYESNLLRELISVITDADSKDVERLSQLISDWGMKQLNDIAEVIRGQIQIIGRLQELVDSDTIREIELHRLIEKNLWLIRDGLELWSSDQPLYKLIDRQLDKNYKDRLNLRPDIICRSRDGGREAIVIEFKRPSETIGPDHVTQAIQYYSVIKEHRPQIKVDLFVVGRKYSPQLLNAGDLLTGVKLYSFGDILQRTRSKFEEILDILGR